MAFDTRMEMLGALFVAMASVTFSGDLPNNVRLDYAPLLVTDASEIVEPLVYQFPNVVKMRDRRWCHYKLPFHPSRFIYDRYGLTWGRGLDWFLQLDVKPSAALRFVALRAAAFDVTEGQTVLDSRPAWALKAARKDEFCAFTGSLCDSLWCYPGDPDEIWESLREEMADCSERVTAGGRYVSSLCSPEKPARVGVAQ